jgi:hypothetical protein
VVVAKERGNKANDATLLSLKTNQPIGYPKIQDGMGGCRIGIAGIRVETVQRRDLCSDVSMKFLFV